MATLATAQKSQGQIIYGPDNVNRGTYYVDTTGTDINYYWNVSGGHVVSGQNSDTVLIQWTDTVRKIHVTEIPAFVNNTINVTDAPFNATGNDTTTDDFAFQTALDSLNTLGGGTLIVPTGTFHIVQLFLHPGVRIQGAGMDSSILRRPIGYISNDTIRMLTTYYTSGNSNVFYSFLTENENNSRPIEISGLQLDGIDSNTNAYVLQHNALIYLDNADTIPGPQYIKINGILYDSHHFYSNGNGKLKVFIHDCFFKNCGSNGIEQRQNIDLTFIDSKGDNLFRGTMVLTGGGGKSLIRNITTLATDITMSGQHGLDLEMDPGVYGYGHQGYRAWVDSSQFIMKADFDFRRSKLLLTDIEVLEGPIYFLGSNGDLLSQRNLLHFNTAHNYAGNSLVGPMCGRFEQCTFKLFNTNGCYRGLNFRDYSGGQIYNTKLGFNGCSFIADSASFVGSPGPKYGIYNYAPNTDTIVQFFFNNCTNIGFDSLLAPCLFDTNTCPYVNIAFQLQPNVKHDNSILDCGETEEEMKSHFGYRTVHIDDAFKCNTALLIDTTVELWHNKTAKEVIAQNGNDTFVNKRFYVNEQFEVDSNVTFINCSLYFTPLTSVQLRNPFTLDIDSSTLQAGCDWWYGIMADSSLQKVKIQNESNIKNAIVGVFASNDAVIEISDSHFEDNGGASIQITEMTLNPYSGYIMRNTFTSVDTLPSPYIKSNYGIVIRNVEQLNIGDVFDSTSGNSFNNVYTGIYITYSSNLNNSGEIGVYNNSFENITNNTFTGSYIENQKINHCYSYKKGAAVYATNTVASLNNVHLEIMNSSTTDTSIAFQNCEKAIVTSRVSLNSKYLDINNCLMGIMNNWTTGFHYQIEKNILENNFIGMQFIGDNANSYVEKNTITSTDSFQAVQNGAQSYIWPIGIDIRNVYNTSSPFDVQFNHITMKDYAGTGISVINTGDSVNAYNNIIGLTTVVTGELECAGATLLNGIYATNAIGSKINRNEVNGSDSLLIPERDDIAGIYISNGWGCGMQCNLLSKTRFGIVAQSRCNTDSLYIKGNVLHDQILGWVFRHLGTEGTFGQVGGDTLDNSNLFLGSNYIYKVFKFCDSALGDPIYTNSVNLEQIESGSLHTATQTQGLCNYSVLPNQGAVSTYSCPVVYIFLQDDSASTFTLSEAIEIATNTKSYSEFPEISHWMDSRKLFDQLNHDGRMLSNDTISEFYNTLKDGIIKQLAATEDRIKVLIASMVSQDHELYLERLEEASESNSNIVSEEEQEANEAAINEIYLKIIRYGLESLTTEDSTFIVELANSCPYIGGTAVYKARALYAMYAPASMFDDIKICNNIGVYKTNNTSGDQKGRFDDENTYLKGLKLNPEKALLSESDLLVYPNPANMQINIRYKNTKDTRLQLVNILGIVLKEIFLSKDIQKVSVNVADLPNGVYIYRQIDNKTILKTGKLIISN